MKQAPDQILPWRKDKQATDFWEVAYPAAVKHGLQHEFVMFYKRSRRQGYNSMDSIHISLMEWDLYAMDED